MKIIVLLLCLVCGLLHANIYKIPMDNWEPFSEPTFETIPTDTNIMESYRFTWYAGMDGFDRFVRISKVLEDHKISYWMNSVIYGYDSKKVRNEIELTKQEWDYLLSYIEKIPHQTMEAEDKRGIFDAGSIYFEVYKDFKSKKLWRYHYREKELFAEFFNASSLVYHFHKKLLKDKNRKIQTFDLELELNAYDKQQQDKIKKQQEIENKLSELKRRFEYENNMKQQIWKSVETGSFFSLETYKDLNLNIKNAQGQTPLMIAVKNGFDTMIVFFQDSIVNVREKDSFGKTALNYIKKPSNSDEAMLSRRMYAALRILEVQQIVKGKAKVAQYEYKNETDTLQISLRGTQCSAFVFPRYVKCTGGTTPTTSNKEIFDAIRDHNNTLFDQLLPTADKNMKDAHNFSLLWWAIIKNNLYAVDTLLQNGAVVDEKDNNNHHTPIFYAAINNDVALLKVLLKHDANPNSQNIFGNYVLSSAMLQCKNFEAIAFLLDNGANPYLKNRLGKTIFEQQPTSCKDSENAGKMKQLLETKVQKG